MVGVGALVSLAVGAAGFGAVPAVLTWGTRNLVSHLAHCNNRPAGSALWLLSTVLQRGQAIRVTGMNPIRRERLSFRLANGR